MASKMNKVNIAVAKYLDSSGGTYFLASIKEDQLDVKGNTKEEAVGNLIIKLFDDYKSLGEPLPYIESFAILEETITIPTVIHF